MRHLKLSRKFGRTSAHRKALFRNQVTALLTKERIRTTLAKAKELRSHVEKTITLGKKGTLHARRQALTLVKGKEAFTKLFGTLSERYAGRNGGYTRIIKLGNRRGDDAPMAYIELVDREVETGEEAPVEEKKSRKKTKAAPETAEKKVETKKKTETKATPAKKKTETKKEGDAKKATAAKPAAKKKAAD